MTDHDTGVDARVAQLETELAALGAARAADRADLEAVRAQVMGLHANPGLGTTARLDDPPPPRRRGRRRGARSGEEREPTGRMSRRRLLGFAGTAAAAGVGGALLAASPAAAVTDLELDVTNSSTTGLTALTSSTTSGTVFAVTASANGPSGLTGNTQNSTAVTGTSVSGPGVVANSQTGIALEGSSGQNAGLVLADNGVDIPPTTNNIDWLKGSFVNSHGQLWYCTAQGIGAAATFVRLSATLTLLSTPARVYDSRVGQLPSTGPKSPIGNNATVTVDVTLNSGIPSTATGVLGNLTVTNTTGPGFLTIFNHLGTRPATSNINYSLGQNLANSFTSSCTGTNKLDVFNGGPATDFIVDIVGYYP